MFGRDLRVALVVAVVVGSPWLLAAGPFDYREYTLDSTLATVVDTSGERLQVGQWGVYRRNPPARSATGLPAAIQELGWRPPFERRLRPQADPVREVLFSFYADQLYRVAITYDPDRTEGLTDQDVVQALTATYGAPVAADLITAQRPRGGEPLIPSVIVAQWVDESSFLTLSRGASSREFELVLVSKIVHPDARAVILDTLRLDTRQATERQLAEREQDLARARQAGRSAGANKAAFRP